MIMRIANSLSKSISYVGVPYYYKNALISSMPLFDVRRKRRRRDESIELNKIPAGILFRPVGEILFEFVDEKKLLF